MNEKQELINYIMDSDYNSYGYKSLDKKTVKELKNILVELQEKEENNEQNEQ